MTSDIEARILGIERRVWQLPLWALEARAAAIEQSLWQSWMYQGGATPPPDCIHDFDAIFLAAYGSACCIPDTITLTDTYYGDTVLTWDGMNVWWRGCKQISYPGTVLCGAVSAPIQYTLYGDDTTISWDLEVAWIGAGGIVCPTTGKTCADTMTRTQTHSQTMQCYPAITSWSFTGGSSGQIYPTGINPTLSIGS